MPLIPFVSLVVNTTFEPPCFQMLTSIMQKPEDTQGMKLGHQK